MSRAGRPRRGGMTLIEVMVAITIFAIVATIVFGGFDQTMRNKARMEAQTDRAHVIRMALERMVREIGSAYVSIHVHRNPSFRTMSTCFIGGSTARGDRLDFTSFSHRRLYRDAHESDQNELSYFLTNHPEIVGQRVLARREQRRVDDDPQSGGSVQILIEDVLDLEFEYLDPLNGEWLDSWDATMDAGQQPNRLPTQVKIRVTVPAWSGRGEEVYATRAQPMITWALNHAVYAGQ
ncbi:MAG: type II secretion system protein GspJ [Sandaracinaceae bacterium]